MLDRSTSNEDGLPGVSIVLAVLLENRLEVRILVGELTLGEILDEVV